MRPARLPDLLSSLRWLLPVVDLLTVGLAAVGSALLSFARDTTPLWPFNSAYQVAVTFAMVLTPLVFNRVALYRSHRGESLAMELIQVAAGWLTVFLVLAVIAIATKTSGIFSRVWMLSWLVSGLVMLCALRIVLRIILTELWARGWDSRDVVIVGSGPEAARVVKMLRSLPGAGFHVTGYFSNSPAREAAFADIPCLGSYGDLGTALAGMVKPPDQVWIALPVEQMAQLRKVVEQISRTTLDCRLVPDTLDHSILNHSVSQIGGLPVMDLSSSPMTGLNRVLKAVEDKLLGTVILLFVAPLMLLIAVLIRLESAGPVLFRQKRHGWNGEDITILKFRTMVVHSEAPGQVTQAHRNDPRLTRVGRWLRRTSLDELPQFFNVLGGTMSIVGPRPHAVEHNRYYADLVGRYILRHKMKPGITGWAQVNGLRGETESVEMMRQRIEYDLYYIEHWSIWFDLAIVGLTLVRGLVSRRAY